MVIKLTQGKVALIDDEDFSLIESYSWRAHNIRGRWYATSGNPYSLIYMHRLILGLTQNSELEADHKNGNGLDNRRSNLREATRSQNSANKSKMAHKKFKGVHKNNGRYRAQITVLYKRIHLGYFDSEEDAARAYDVAAKEHFGEFAQTNF